MPQPEGGAPDLERRYDDLIGDRAVRALLGRGGQVFLASEGQPAWKVERLLRAGHRHFAEKYVQEATSKWPALRRRASGLVLHGFGRLQTNKIAAACRVFDALEAVGRRKEIAALRALALGSFPVPPVAIQVNSGAEPQKSGFLWSEVDAAIEAMREAGIEPFGAMMIPPKGEEPAAHFRMLRRLVDRHRLRHCIMGMSGDFAQAVACGSTIVRIGRRVFGEKPAKTGLPAPDRRFGVVTRCPAVFVDAAPSARFLDAEAEGDRVPAGETGA